MTVIHEHELLYLLQECPNIGLITQSHIFSYSTVMFILLDLDLLNAVSHRWSAHTYKRIGLYAKSPLLTFLLFSMTYAAPSHHTVLQRATYTHTHTWLYTVIYSGDTKGVMVIRSSLVAAGNKNSVQRVFELIIVLGNVYCIKSLFIKSFKILLKKFI